MNYIEGQIRLAKTENGCRPSLGISSVSFEITWVKLYVPFVIHAYFRV